MPIYIDKQYLSLQMQLLLSVQRALLNEVDNNLRSVQIDWDDESQIIYLFFYFDKKVTEKNSNSASCVAGEIAGDFLSTVNVIEKCIRVDCPNEIPSHALTAFKRKEN